MIALPKVFTASLLLAILALGDSRQCFWPDHSPAPSNFTECNAGAAQSACCQNSDACLSNGLCLQQVGFANRIVRGACTDSTFSNAACPAQCTSVQPNKSVSFFPANVSPNPGGNGLFCCVGSYNGTSQLCDYASDDNGDLRPFSLPVGSVIVDRSNGAALSKNSTSGPWPTDIVTITTNSESKITAVGVGLGVSLGVLLITALVGCGVLYNQLRKAKRQIHENDVMKDQPKHSLASSAANELHMQYSDDLAKPYNQIQHPLPRMAPVESPFDNFVAEAPTDREVALADSRVVSSNSKREGGP